MLSTLPSSPTAPERKELSLSASLMSSITGLELHAKAKSRPFDLLRCCVLPLGGPSFCIGSKSASVIADENGTGFKLLFDSHRLDCQGQ